MSNLARTTNRIIYRCEVDDAYIINSIYCLYVVERVAIGERALLSPILLT